MRIRFLSVAAVLLGAMGVIRGFEILGTEDEILRNIISVSVMGGSLIFVAGGVFTFFNARDF